MRRVIVTIVAVLGVPWWGAGTWAVAQPAESKDPQAQLQRGVALYREAGYAASVAALEQARATGGLALGEQLSCAFYLAADYVALGSTGAARRELRAIVERQPGYELPPFTSPKVVALFREVQDEVERQMRLRAMVPRRHGLAEIELPFEVARAGGSAFGAAWWRWRGEADYREVPLAHDGENLVAHLTIAQAGTLEYYAQARGPSGLAQAGSREHPLELPVAVGPAAAGGAARVPLYKRWWLWTAVGVVAAAGLGVGLYFALKPAPPAASADAVVGFQLQ